VTNPEPPTARQAAATSRSLAAIVAGSFLLIISFLPIANWLPGGHDAPWYSLVGQAWISATAIVVGAAVVLVILGRRIPFLWRPGATHPLVQWADEHPVWFGAVVATAAFTLYSIVAMSVFSARPLSIDEVVQVIQARTFARGRLWEPTSHPEFYSILNMVDIGGRSYAQFPPGGPAILSLGVLVGAPWIIGPLCGAIAVAAFWAALRAWEGSPAVAVGATLLFAAAPFHVFMSASHMNHAPTLMLALVALAALTHGMSSAHARPWLAALGGFALGAMATIRPVDALAFALPAGAWYVGRAIRKPRRWSEVVAAGVGVALPVACMLFVNARTTGAPLLFGYEVLWGKGHDLGFHRAPYGLQHTPRLGLELINIYFLRLQTYLFDAAVPSLTPVVAALFLTRQMKSADRYALVSAALIVALYAAYWFDGFMFGPRFIYTLVPFLALWTARLPSVLAQRFGDGWQHRFVVYAYCVAAVLAITSSLPVRVQQYSRSLMPMRADYLAPAERANVRGALIFVRESWGSQLVARMWAVGVSRSTTEALYRGVDACALETAIHELELQSTRDSLAEYRLVPLLRDSLKIVRSTYSPDDSERLLPGSTYTGPCSRRIAEDRAGFTLFAPLLYQDWGQNVYARELHDRDSLLIREYVGRPVYLLRPESDEPGSPLKLFPVTRDSAQADWATTR